MVSETAFPNSECGQTARTNFNEVLAANEFGLALETLCDCLLDEQDSVITSDTLATISALHAKMALDDNCTMLLRGKGSFPQ